MNHEGTKAQRKPEGITAQQLVNCLYLNDQRILDDDIETITAIKIEPFVVYRHRHLSAERDGMLGELMTKALLVRRFEQPRPQAPMYLDGEPDYLVVQ